MRALNHRLKIHTCVLIALSSMLVLTSYAPPLEAKEHRVFENTIADEATWQRLSKKVGTDRFTKFIIDLKSGAIYFIDVNLFKLHSDFVFGVLLKKERTPELNREYNRNYTRNKPRFVLGYLTEHLNADLFTYAFWEGDDIDAVGIKMVYDTLRPKFFKQEISFRPDSPKQEKQAEGVKALGLRTTSNDALYKAADFQSFNAGEAIGRLRIVPIGTPYESLIFERDDIVILQESYPDISPVSGIVSTVFSTPLSHVNLRARAWKVPNAGYVKAREAYEALDGKMVYFKVSADTHLLREASSKEIEEAKSKAKNARRVKLPRADTFQRRLKPLSSMRIEDSRSYGTKSSNLGAIASARLKQVHVPPGFGVPFSHYAAHMQRHGLDLEISSMLRDKRWKQDASWRKQITHEIRQNITEAEMAPRLLDDIEKMVNTHLQGKGVFVRSSTNAEDLDGFNGAGLYDTIGNVQGREALARAVKQVWASLWNFRAVEERELYGIDHRQVYSGVLIQYGIDASAAGVLVTTNLFDPSDRATYTINAKRGLGIRVVEGATVPEQILFDTKNYGTKIISRSDDPTMLVFDEEGGIVEVTNPNRGVILDEVRSKRLAMAVRSFVRLLPSRAPLDVEWALEGEKVWILQARPFIGY